MSTKYWAILLWRFIKQLLIFVFSSWSHWTRELSTMNHSKFNYTPLYSVHCIYSQRLTTAQNKNIFTVFHPSNKWGNWLDFFSIRDIFYSQFYSFLLISFNFRQMQLFGCAFAQHKRYTVAWNVFSSNIYTPAKISHFLHQRSSMQSDKIKAHMKKESAYTRIHSFSFTFFSQQEITIHVAGTPLLNVILQFWLVWLRSAATFIVFECWYTQTQTCFHLWCLIFGGTGNWNNTCRLVCCCFHR